MPDTKSLYEASLTIRDNMTDGEIAVVYSNLAQAARILAVDVLLADKRRPLNHPAMGPAINAASQLEGVAAIMQQDSNLIARPQLGNVHPFPQQRH